MKILVTGGAGFIGSHLVDRLLQLEHEVVVVDNLATGYRRNLNPCAKFYEASLLDSSLDEIFQREKPDIVSHHAAQNDVRRSNADPVFDAQHNIVGSIRLLRCCIEHGVEKVIYASSGGTVYGEPTYLPVDEVHPIVPISPYGISKHTVEHYLFLASVNASLNYTVLRYANIYGPRNIHTVARGWSPFSQNPCSKESRQPFLGTAAQHGTIFLYRTPLRQICSRYRPVTGRFIM